MGYLTHGTEAGGKTYDLLPCPFCGGEAEFRDGSSTKPYIRCKSCGCRTWGSHAYDRLVAAWNRRAERTCRVESSHEEEGDGCYSYFEYELTCGHEIAWADQLPPSYCPECGRRVLYDVNKYL